MQMDDTVTSQSRMDLNEPYIDPTPPPDCPGPHPESNTAEMEAAWTNCSRRAQVEDVSDNNDSDSESSESVDLDSNTNLFSDEDEDDEERTHQQDFGNLGLRFQLRAAQAGVLYNIDLDQSVSR